MRGKFNPNFLIDEEKKAANIVQNISSKVSLKQEKLNLIFKGDEELDLQIRNLKSQINEFNENVISRLSSDCDKINSENEELKNQIKDLSFLVFSQNQEAEFIPNIHGKTPFFKQNLLRSLLLQQKVKLFQLCEEHKQLMKNCLCLENDENLSSFYSIDEETEYRFELLSDDQFNKNYNQLFEDLIRDEIESQSNPILHKSIVAGNEICEIMNDKQQNIENENGVEFIVAPNFSKENNSFNGHNNLTFKNFIKKIDENQKNSALIQEKISSLLDKQEFNTSRIANMKQDITINFLLHSLQPKCRTETVQQLNHSQEIVELLSKSLNSGGKDIQKMWSQESKIREVMNKTVHNLHDASKILSDNIRAENGFNPFPKYSISNKPKTVDVSSQLQIDKAQQIAFDAANSLSEFEAKQRERNEIIKENLESIHQTRNLLNDRCSDDEIDSDDYINDINEINDIIRNIQNQHSQAIDIFTKAFENIDENIFNHEDFNNITEEEDHNHGNNNDPSGENYDINQNMYEKYPELTELENSDLLKHKKIIFRSPVQMDNKELLATIRAKQYNFDALFDDEIEPEKTHEINIKNHVMELFDKWRRKNVSSSEMKDPALLSLERDKYQEELKNLQDEYERRHSDFINGKMKNEKNKKEVSDLKINIQEKKKSIEKNKNTLKRIENITNETSKTFDDINSEIERIKEQIELANRNFERQKKALELKLENFKKEKEEIDADIERQKSEIRAKRNESK